MWDEGSEAWQRLARRRRADALEALTDIGELRRLLDRVELEAVRDARADGRSWAEIATRLGVTRQSAWERWRDLDAEGRPVDPEDPLVHGDRQAIPVPDVRGHRWQAALARLHRSSLHGVSDDPLLPPFDDESQDFLVENQKPGPGERVAPHTVVTLWLRRGPGSAGVTAPLEPPPPPRVRRGAIDEETGESVR
ncbi:PASTA domain-containing protein [Pseudonocardia endophytica]|uniref:PASTA domain-containing protein n=2 Tax=Pseudonocardia endophytica TaxID=401976 RepID=A0A4R1HPA2_PSEEN|nr:PASTA domain-containing protein [Pseudonocardia endophytica]